MSESKDDQQSTKPILNENVGVLGHIDAGKTALCRRLSEIASTAAFDKDRQAQERGMTLDLGFSAAFAPLPDHFDAQARERYSRLQFTLVDCPGHASLIRTIMGGARIIRQMLLVIDALKGVQTQTAECLVLGELTAERLVVVVNKLDQLRAPRNVALAKLMRKLRNTLKSTRFADAPIVAVAATDQACESQFCADFPDEAANVGVARLLEVLRNGVAQPASEAPAPQANNFLFAYDHAFNIKGQGTVLTGTVLRGSVEPNQNVELVDHGESRRVKSIQQFRRPSSRAVAGERAGLCLTKLDASKLERGLLAAPESVPSLTRIVARVEKIRYYRSAVRSNVLFHVSIGHATVMASLLLFGTEQDAAEATGFDGARDYLRAEGELPPPPAAMLAVVTFEQPVRAPSDSQFIGARLDTDVAANVCRLAFQGRILHVMSSDEPLPRVYRTKTRYAAIHKVNDDKKTVIAKNLFANNADFERYVGLTVTHSRTGAKGRIDSLFGQTGKFKVLFRDGIGEDSGENDAEPARLVLEFKQFVSEDATGKDASSTASSSKASKTSKAVAKTKAKLKQ